MRFGAVPENKLAEIDWRMPPEPGWNSKVLPGKRHGRPRVFLGAAVWGSPAWNGAIYPLKTPADQYRLWYPRQFNAIELNATHYNIYPPQVIRDWAEGAWGRAFRFCPKFPQQISHDSGGRQEPLTDAFLQSIAAFEAQLGPAFLQLSEHAAPLHRDALYDYLRGLPAGFSCFLEVRHPVWMQADILHELLQQLYAMKKGLLITDTPGRRDLLHGHLTVPKTFLRFVSPGAHPTTFPRIDAWITRIADWLQRGLEEMYIFLHPGHDALVPELAEYWIHALNEKCGLDLLPPTRVQARLF